MMKNYLGLGSKFGSWIELTMNPKMKWEKMEDVNLEYY